MSSSAPPAGSPLALVRPEILQLVPYDHAAWEPSLVRLHANELPWRPSSDVTAAGLNRYPEPQPQELVQRLAALYEIAPRALLVGRGSDEGIDLLTRAFCRAGHDSVIVCPPTFGMYAVAARIQGAEVIRVPLAAERGFALDASAILERCTPAVKLVFVCSPNNPTANLLDETRLLQLASQLAGRALLVIDEAYVEFSGAPSLARHVDEYSHLVVLRTLSKAHGLAGARCGTTIAAPEIIATLRKIIPPYALTQLTIETVLSALQPAALAATQERLRTLRAERERVTMALRTSRAVKRIWPSDANFVLVEFLDATAAFNRVRAAGLLVRDVRSQPGLGDALRITIGTPEQNERLLAALDCLPARAAAR